MRPLPSFLCFFCCLTTAAIAAPERDGERAPAGPAVMREINLARSHPEIYAGRLQQLRATFRGDLLVLPGGTLLRTKEGVRAVDEAIRFLQKQNPLPPLDPSRGMCAAAADHVADQRNGDFGHAGSDRSNPGERLNRYGTWHVLWGENISYGKATARDIVMALIVDDGLPGRKHRKNIFNPEFHFAGAAVGPHARYRTLCSIEFAAVYLERGQSLGAGLLAGN